MPREERRVIEADGRRWPVRVLRRSERPPEAPRLVIVGFMPNAAAEAICRACVAGVRRFTDTPHELWVVDNGSPRRHAAWLREDGELNVILNPRRPAPGGILTRCRIAPSNEPAWRHGSYANGIALELAARIIAPDTHRMMTLHMDTFPCRRGWLAHLASKLDDRVRVAGVRRDTARGEVIHCLGMLFDFTLFGPLGLTFMPDLPRNDVGDRITHALRDAGYGLYACRNTHSDPAVARAIPPDDPAREAPVDRALDDEGHVIFLHLGRGVEKSMGADRRGGRFGPDDWLRLTARLLGAGAEGVA